MISFFLTLPKDFRDDFIKGLLTSDIHDEKIFSYILKDNEYANKVSDPRTYGVITREVISRWVYPIVLNVPELKIKDKGFNAYSHNNIYRVNYKNSIKTMNLGRKI